MRLIISFLLISITYLNCNLFKNSNQITQKQRSMISAFKNEQEGICSVYSHYSFEQTSDLLLTSDNIYAYEIQYELGFKFVCGKYQVNEMNFIMLSIDSNKTISKILQYRDSVEMGYKYLPDFSVHNFYFNDSIIVLRNKKNNKELFYLLENK